MQNMDEFFDPRHPIYTDASAYFADNAYFARAGVAALQIEHGKISAMWRGEVPGPVAANAAVGEQLAAIQATRLSPDPLPIVDCAAVVSNISNPQHVVHPKTRRLDGGKKCREPSGHRS